MKLFILNVIAWFILVGFFYQQQAQQWFGETQTAERTYEDSTGFYLLQFEYNTAQCMIPATYPPGQPHYSATITVYEIINGKREMIGEPFGGTYTENGCFEDEPSYLIQTAKELREKTYFNNSIDGTAKDSTDESVIFSIDSTQDFNNWTIQDYTIGVGDFEITSFYFDFGLRISWKNGIIDVEYPDSMNATEVAKEFFEALSKYMIDGYFLSKSEWQKFTCETNESFTEGETIFRKK